MYINTHTANLTINGVTHEPKAEFALTAVELGHAGVKSMLANGKITPAKDVKAGATTGGGAPVVPPKVDPVLASPEAIVKAVKGLALDVPANWVASGQPNVKAVIVALGEGFITNRPAIDAATNSATRETIEAGEPIASKDDGAGAGAGAGESETPTEPAKDADKDGDTPKGEGKTTPTGGGKA